MFVRAQCQQVRTIRAEPQRVTIHVPHSTLSLNPFCFNYFVTIGMIQKMLEVFEIRCIPTFQRIDILPKDRQTTKF